MSVLKTLVSGNGQEGKGKAGLTPHSSEAGGTHSGVLCYNIIADFGAGRERSVVAQASTWEVDAGGWQA